MKKIGIVTLIDYRNYGNRLQSFALQEVLKAKKLSPYTLVVEKEPFVKKVYYQMKGFALKSFLIISFYNKITGRHAEVYKEANENRQKRFKKFSKKYIKTKTVQLGSHKGKRIIKKTQYFFVGSDQVWNPAPWLEEEQAFLKFCPQEKRIAYAASFGVEEITEEKRKLYANALAGIPFISVRERSGQKIVKELTGKEAKLFLDPTLMLQKDQWVKIENSIKIECPYILAYFLGKIEENIQNILEKYDKKDRCTYIELSSLNSDTKIWNITGPSEFLFLIHHAEFILTDSFHGVVFSIIFHKNFYAFRGLGEREAWFDRIQTLLELVGMTDRIYEKGKTKTLEKISEERWKLCDECLEKERKRNIKELEQIL